MKYIFYTFVCLKRNLETPLIFSYDSQTTSDYRELCRACKCPVLTWDTIPD